MSFPDPDHLKFGDNLPEDPEPPTTLDGLRAYAIEQAGEPDAHYVPCFDMEWHAVVWALGRVSDNTSSSDVGR